jgi:mycofactocin system transcriptional regulator
MMNATKPVPISAGRGQATSHSQLSQIALQLFIERGFDQTTVDEIAKAAGVGRRTLFRYFPTKNDLPWGNFDSLLESLRSTLARADRNLPLIDALREAVIEFNSFSDDELVMHRSRMRLLLSVPTLMAHSTLRYAEWRQVIAEFVANRIDVRPHDLPPQTIAWASLGICLAAYEQWLNREDADLVETFEIAFSNAEAVFGAALPRHEFLKESPLA